MITLKRITSADSDEYAYAEKLLTTSFPLEEYRPLKSWKELTDNHELFNNNVILDEGKVVGIMTIWDLEDYYYIEHFAVDESLRNNGYGSNALTVLEKYIDKPVVLEVEMPTTNTAKRRLAFYKRYGFIEWKVDYVQPPYRETDSGIPMLLLCRGELDEEMNCKEVKRKLYSIVYNIA